MDGLIMRQAVEGDHAALEDLFRRTPMGSHLQIGFERDPNYFAGSRVQADEPCVYGAFEGGGYAVGLFAAGSRTVWLDGEVKLRYLSDLRIDPRSQRTGLLGRGFRLLRRQVFQPGEWAQTLVLENNRQALQFLASGRAGLPRYQPAGRYGCWLLPAQRIETKASIQVRRARMSDLGTMQELLDAAARRRSFAGLWKVAELGGPSWPGLGVDDFLMAERDGFPVGMVGIWDQSKFQRMRIQRYSKMIAVLRPLSNAWAAVPLPRAGQILQVNKVTAIACADDDPSILKSLLAAALSREGNRLLMLGLSTQDPLTTALVGLKARRDFGRHFLVGWEGQPPSWEEPFSFDVARI